jgi:hypothetical protein
LDQWCGEKRTYGVELTDMADALTRQRLPFMSNLRSRIEYKVEAGKQFLVVVVGLGLTSSISEKLKYGLRDNIGINWPDPDGLTRGSTTYSISSVHSSTLYDPEFISIDTVCLAIFLFYAIRFFFNNYVYLCQAYDEYKLSTLDVIGLRHVSFDASLDLLLNLFTGIIICVVSMALDPRRVLYLLLLLIVHYVVDMVILGIIWFRRRKELQAKGIFMRVVIWICNNILFTLAFCVLLGLILGGIQDDETRLQRFFVWTIFLWFVNCCVGVAVTAIWRDQEGELI